MVTFGMEICSGYYTLISGVKTHMLFKKTSSAIGKLYNSVI